MPRKKPELKWFAVPYRVTCEGIASVEAVSAEEARAMVDAGDFENHPDEGRVDWESRGPAREER
jgi:hypothetical protein